LRQQVLQNRFAQWHVRHDLCALQLLLRGALAIELALVHGLDTAEQAFAPFAPLPRFLALAQELEHFKHGAVALVSHDAVRIRHAPAHYRRLQAVAHLYAMQRKAHRALVHQPHCARGQCILDYLSHGVRHAFGPRS
jgi:hypothetical protein